MERQYRVVPTTAVAVAVGHCDPAFLFTWVSFPVSSGASWTECGTIKSIFHKVSQIDTLSVSPVGHMTNAFLFISSGREAWRRSRGATNGHPL